MDTVVQAPTAERRTTTAADGLPRWRWTTEEVVRLSELGAFSVAERFELLGGEIVPMASMGRRHALVVEAFDEVWKARQQKDVRFGEQKQYNLDSDTFTVPDLLVWTLDTFSYDVRGPDALLVVEVSDTTLQTDLNYKRHLYARYGVREYWVVHAWDLTTRIHMDPVDGDYRSVIDLPASQLLTPHLVPTLAIRLSDLKL